MPRKRDLRHICQIIPDGYKACQKLLMVVNCMAAQDKEAMKAHLASSACSSPADCDLTIAHPVYPLMTPMVWKQIEQQSICILNGCLSDSGALYCRMHNENYCNTDVFMPT